MTLKIIHKNNTSAGQAPTSGDLDIGEIAVNSADAKLYTKDNDGVVQEFISKFEQAGSGAVKRTVESKLQDVVSVKDFGAVGDGIEDDTIAIQAAIDTQLPVFLPEGRYLHTGLTIDYTKASITGQGSSSVLIYNGENAAISVDAGVTPLSLGTFSDFQIELNGDACVGIKYVSPSTNFRHTRLTFLRPIGNSISTLTDTSIGVSYVNTAAFTGIHQFYGCRWERFATAIDVNPVGVEVTELLFESCVFNTVRRAIYDHQSTPNTMPCTFRVDKCVADVSSNAENVFYSDVGGCQILNTRIETKTGWDTCVAGSTTEACPFHFGPNTQQSVVANCAFIPLDLTSYLFEGIRNTFIHGQAEWIAHKSISFDQNNSVIDAENIRIGLGSNNFTVGENILVQDSAPAIRLQDSTNTYSVTTVLATGGAGAGNVDVNLGQADDRYSVNAFSLRGKADETSVLGEASRRWDVVYAATGTINTSDQRTKQNIRLLSSAELRVAATLKGLIRGFQFKDAIQVKGDEARIHFGVVAQEVIAAFQAEGLDPMRYGIVCYDQWDTELDDNGKEITPAGDRYGIRYEELLAFIIAAL